VPGIHGFQAGALLKIPAKQGTIAQIRGDRRSFYEVQDMPGYLLAFLFLSSFCMHCKVVVDNGSWDTHIMGLL